MGPRGPQVGASTSGTRAAGALGPAPTIDLERRLAAGRCYLACVGQFKRGKSTLIDALVGGAGGAGGRLLPSGVVPVTTVPTVVRFGAERRAQVRLGDQPWREVPLAALADYVSEQRNPQNQKGVAGVEVFTPSPLLASGLCLVDTPGLGSVFASNTAATRELVPQLDAALVVIGADPPLAGEELELVAEVAARVPDLVFVLNKADRASPQDCAAAAAFARQVLEARLGRLIGPIYPVSALQQIESRGAGLQWAALLAAVKALAARGDRLAQAAAVRGQARLARLLLALVNEEQAALEQPAAASQRRLAALCQTGAAAQAWLADLGALGAGEQQRLAARCAQRRQQALPGLRAAAQAELAAALPALPRRGGAAYRRAAFAAAQQVARLQLEPWLIAEQAAAEEAFRAAMQRFLALAREFAARCAAQGVALADGLEAVADGLRAPSSFYFCEFLARAEPASPLRWLADAALGAARAYGPLRADAARFLDLLLDTNSRRVQSDLEERLLASRRQLEAELRSLFAEIAAATESARERAQQAQAAGAAALAERRAHLLRLAAELAALSA
ncbi:MAG TPA: dynamin family protein [Terriglobales bacterium]|nr:dynamin family protein [Terriglobales bacterium]